jgi:glycosyltransferase involved in cell wall biosynthesis
VTPTLVTIGLLTYNRADALRRAAASALGQDWPSIELLICDNASTDDTEAVCDELARSDARVRVFRHDRNVGAVANFAEVLGRATGEYFMWLADDDWLDPSYVSSCVRLLIEHPDYAIVCGRPTYTRGDQSVFAERPVHLRQRSGSARVVAFFRTVTLNGPFYGVMRRDQLASVPAQPSLGGDWLLIASIAFLGKVEMLPAVAIHRSLDGASRDSAQLAQAFGLAGHQTRNWHLTIARAAYADIMSNPVYAPLPRIARLVLGLCALCLIVFRFSFKVSVGRVLSRVGLFHHSREALERRRRRTG